MTAHFSGSELPTPVLTATQAFLIRTSVTFDGGYTRYIFTENELESGDARDLVDLGLATPVYLNKYHQLTDEGLIVYARITRTKGASGGLG